MNSTFPRRGSSEAYSQHVSAHDTPMRNAGCDVESRSKITRMKLAQSEDWVTIYFRTPSGTLLGTDYAKISEGPKVGVENATKSFDSRFPQWAGKYVVCHE